MRFFASRFSVVKTVFLLALLLGAGSWAMYVNSLRLQQEQARRTLGLLKSMALWQRELLEKNELPPSRAEMPPVNLYTEQFYASLDTHIFALSLPPRAYLLAFSRPGTVDFAPYGLYVESREDKVFCLAQIYSGAAKRFCADLGADTAAPVPTELQSRRELAGYDAYPLDWSGVSPLVDEPVAPLRE